MMAAFETKPAVRMTDGKRDRASPLMRREPA